MKNFSQDNRWPGRGSKRAASDKEQRPLPLHLPLKKTKTKLRGLSPQANYTDRATTTVGEVVPTFAGRGCYVVGATDSHGR
jgi:hypothetical protein